MPQLKKDAPLDVLEISSKAEAQADDCRRALRILQNPSNVAIWALLTGGIGIVKREQAGVSVLVSAEVWRVEIALRRDGRRTLVWIEWSHERITGELYFLVDPANWRNQVIADL